MTCFHRELKSKKIIFDSACVCERFKLHRPNATYLSLYILRISHRENFAFTSFKYSIVSYLFVRARSTCLACLVQCNRRSLKDFAGGFVLPQQQLFSYSFPFFFLSLFILYILIIPFASNNF